MSLIIIVAIILLTLRLFSVIFMSMVLVKQFKLFGKSINSEYARDIITFRRVLFGLAVIIFIGQLVPIVIDIATVFAHAPRSAPNPLGIAYGLSNAITAVLSSIAFWLMYKVAERGSTKEVNK